MFLFIFESIGTSELLLIGVIALMFLGPRKIPGMARTVGKYMSEFRKTTSDFKSTWEKEVDFAMEEETAKKQNAELSEVQVPRTSPALGEGSPIQNGMNVPEIKQIDESAFAGLLPKKDAPDVDEEHVEIEEPKTGGKQDWL